MLPQPIFSFENFKDLDTIVELKRLQIWVTYFCTRPLCPRKLRIVDMEKDKNRYSDYSDHELIDLYEHTGDPWTHEAIKAEERRRTSEKALEQAITSNKIAIASFFIAFGSLIIAVIAITT